jgi:amidase
VGCGADAPQTAGLSTASAEGGPAMTAAGASSAGAANVPAAGAPEGKRPDGLANVGGAAGDTPSNTQGPLPEAKPATEPEPAELALVEATIGELRRALATRLVTPAELTEMYLTRIAAYDNEGPALNAFLHLNTNAIADANALGARCEEPAAPPLCGIPIVLKDNIDTADMPTTAGSLALAGSLPESDAFLTRRLREAGAIIVGKATLTEFANFLSTNMPSGYSSLGGFGYNPYDPRALPGADGRPALTPGGSSSGSAIAVSANLAAGGVGTETSGSILSPASSNGLVGIKPTLGLVSRAGIIPISADQDTAGPVARTVTDAAILLGVLAGADAADPATSACLEPGLCESDYTQFLDAGALAGARIAVPQLGNARREIMEAAIDVLREQGATVEELSPLPGQAGTCLSLPAGNICSTVLVYGFKRDLNAYLAATPAAPVGSLAEVIAFNTENAGALAYGQQIALVADALDTSPGSADTLRYTSDRDEALENARGVLDAVYDGPDGVAGTEDDRDALLFSENSGAGGPAIAGYPSITVPGGFAPPTDTIENAFPSGVTFSGRAFAEPRLLALAFAFEQATLHRRPPASTPPLATDTIRR